MTTNYGEPNENIARVLLIEDDRVFRELCSRYLLSDDKYHYQISAVETAHDALVQCESTVFDCLIVDYRLPGHTGTEILSMLKYRVGENLAPTIVMTSEGGEQAAIDAIRAGAYDFMFKRSLTKEAVRRAVGNAVEKGRLRRSIASGRMELKESYKLLTQRNNEIQRFYHNLSHEMKTPLTAIREYISIVNDGLAGPVVDEQKKLLSYAMSGCEQLATQFNDLLDLARLETGKMSVNLADVLVENVIDRCVLAVRSAADAKNITINKTVCPDISESPMDENRIVQVVGNLLDNAIKYTPQDGQIDVVATAVGTTGKVRISVRDTGVGIAPEHLTQVFDRLFQISTPDLQESPCGMGIGLAIASEIVKAHGATIHVTSELGVGSEFSFELEMSQAIETLARAANDVR